MPLQGRVGFSTDTALLTTINSSLNNIEEQVPGAGWNSTNIRLGLLGNGVADIETITMSSSRAGIDTVLAINSGAIPINGVDQTVPLTARIMTVASNNVLDVFAGANAEVVRVIGLDVNYNPIFEDILLNGTTEVDGLLSFLRVNQLLIVRSANGTNVSQNAGDIFCSDNTETWGAVNPGEPDTRVYCTIEVGYGISFPGIFTVKAGYSFINTHYKVTTDASSSKPVEAQNAAKFLTIPEIRIVDLSFGSPDVNFPLVGLPNFPEKTDIIIRSVRGGASNVDRMTVFWSGVLFKHTAFPNSQGFTTPPT